MLTNYTYSLKIILLLQNVMFFGCTFMNLYDIMSQDKDVQYNGLYNKRIFKVACDIWVLVYLRSLSR